MRRKTASCKKVTEAEAVQHLKELSDKLEDVPARSSEGQELKLAIARALKAKQFSYLELQYLDKAMEEVLESPGSDIEKNMGN